MVFLDALVDSSIIREIETLLWMMSLAIDFRTAVPIKSAASAISFRLANLSSTPKLTARSSASENDIRFFMTR